MLQNLETKTSAESSVPRLDAPEAPLTALEKAGVAALFLLLLVLRIVCAQRRQIDSDEPQHLHVVWAWAHHLLQYRDIFDNHSPLFQMLCAPVFALFGERADIVIPMRHLMLPLFAFDLWCVYRIGRRLGSKRLALWATLAAGFAPIFFLCSTEFRTDDLWVAFWLLSLVTLTGGPFGGARAFWAGVTLGASFACSMKSSLLVINLAIAGLFVAVIAARLGWRTDWRKIGLGVAAALLGMLLVPGLVIGYFAARGALHDMYYCVIVHNMAIGGSKMHKFAFKRFWFPIALIVGPIAAFYVARVVRDRASAYRQILLLLFASFYYTALTTFWPLITDQDYMPLDPLVVLGVAPLAVMFYRFRHPMLRAAPALVIAGEIAALVVEPRPWYGKPMSLLQTIRYDATHLQLIGYLRENETQDFIVDLSHVLRLTTPLDFVMDGKGETIFRRRPFFYVLEGVTIKRMRAGAIKDTIIEDLIQTRTCVLRKRRIPEADEPWIVHNYLPDADKIFVAGKRLGPANGSMPFTIGIPAPYTAISDAGIVHGTIDGKPIEEAPFLEAGPHTLQIASGHGEIAVVWSKAVERGFAPFEKRPRAAK